MDEGVINSLELTDKERLDKERIDRAYFEGKTEAYKYVIRLLILKKDEEPISLFDKVI